MSKKKVKERIEMYSQVSRMKEVSIHKFGIYYHPKEKMWFLYLNYKTIEKDKETENDIIEFHEEFECFDDIGWLKISEGFTREDFDIVFSELKPSKFNIKSILIKGSK